MKTPYDTAWGDDDDPAIFWTPGGFVVSLQN